MYFKFPRCVFCSVEEERAFQEVREHLQQMATYADRFHYAIELAKACVDSINPEIESLSRSIINITSSENSKSSDTFELERVFAEKLRLSENRDTLMKLLGNWRRIAARDGAFSIYHFGHTIQAFNGSLRRTGELFSKSDRAFLAEANKLFLSSFPYNEKIRNAVGHEAELLKTQKQIERNVVTKGYDDGKNIRAEEGSELFIIDSFNENRYTTTILGDVYSYEFTHQTTFTLNKIIYLFAKGIGIELS